MTGALDHAWIVICTQGGREHIARHHLERQGYTTYLPMCVIRRGDRIVPTSLFPRYLFVLLDICRDAWRPILSTIGVQAVLMNGDHPGAIPDNTIEAIRRREEAFVSFAAPEEPCPFPSGASVRIKRGPFTGIDAIFAEPLEKKRCALMLQLLGRETRIELALSDVA